MMFTDLFPLGDIPKRALCLALAFVSFPVVAADLKSGQSSSLPVQFELKKREFVSLAIYDDKSRLLRTLAYGIEMEKGRQELCWDGLDQYGNPLPPGKYAWRLLSTPGFTAKYLGRVGTGTPPGQPEAQWISNHGGPRAIACANGYLYVGGATEGGPELVKRAFDNSFQAWGMPGDRSVENSTPVSVATDGREVFWLQDNNEQVLVLGDSFPEVLRRIDLHYDSSGKHPSDKRSGDWGKSLDHGMDISVRVEPPMMPLAVLNWSGIEDENRHNVPGVSVDGGTATIADFAKDGMRNSPGAEAAGGYLRIKPEAGKTASVNIGRNAFENVTAQVNSLAHGDYFIPVDFDLASAEEGIRLKVAAIRADGTNAALVSRRLALEADVLTPPEGFPPVETRSTGSVTGEMRTERFVRVTLNMPLSVVKAASSTPSAGQVVAGTFGGLELTFSGTGTFALDNLRIGKPQAVALANRSLVVSYRNENAVRWLDKYTGKTLEEVSTRNPQAVCVDDNGDAYVISEGKVARLSPKDHKNAEFIIPAGTLVEPKQISFEPVQRHLLVVDGNQVKRFGLDGRLIKAYGDVRGRAFGRWAGNDFAELANVSADGKGGFVTIEGECRVRRTAHFDADGKLLREWLGGQAWGPSVAIDPLSKTRLLTPSGRPKDGLPCGLMVMDVDYKTGETHLRGECSYSPFGDGLFPTITSTKGQMRWTRHAGRSYLESFDQGLGGSHGPMAVLAFDDDACTVKPAALLSSVQAVLAECKALPTPLQAALAAQAVKIDDAKGNLFSWIDKNADGEFQTDEFTFADNPQKLFSQTSIHRLDERWNLTASGLPRLVTVPSAAAPDSLLPQWNLQRATGVDLELSPGWKDKPWRGGGSTGLVEDEHGNLYQFIFGDRGHYTDNQPVGERKLMDSMFGSCRVMKWDRDGHLAWEMGDKQAFNMFQIRDPQTIIGWHRGCLVLHDRVVNPARVVTEDGLYAGSFLDHADVANLTPFQAFVLYRTANGRGRPLSRDQMYGAMVALGADEVIWFRMGLNDTLMYRITGWEGWQRQEGSIILGEKPDAAKRKGAGLSGSYFNNPEVQGNPVLVRNDKLLWFFVGGENIHGPKMRGKCPPGVDTWGDNAPGKEVQADNFSARWTGFVEAPLTETFRFVIRCNRNAGIRLWLNERKLIDRWTKDEHNDEMILSEPMPLKAGKLYPIRLEYSEGGSTKAELQLSWESLSQERHVIPTELLYAAPPK